MVKQLMKINVISILYAIFILVPTELMVNVYRISRLTGWRIETVQTFNEITLIVLIIVGPLIFYFLTAKGLGKSKLNYFTALLWVPYFYLFARGISSLYPIVGEDDPNPVTGLITLGMFILYPFCILLINPISSVSQKVKEDPLNTNEIS